MSHPTSNLQVIASQEHQERVWLARLSALPPGVFDLVVRRIAKGGPVRQIARYLHGVDPGVAEETFRKWLNALSKQVRELLVEKKTVDEAVKIIEESTVTSGEGASAAGRPPGPSAGSSKRLKAIVNSVDKDLRSEMMLKYLWVTGQKRFDKMLDLEEKLGVLLPNVPKQMDTLRSIADSLLKVELGRWALTNGGYVPEVAPPEPGSMAEKASKLDQVDRNLIRAAWGHVMDLFEDKALELQAEQDRKKNDANPENEDQHQHREIQDKPSPPRDQRNEIQEKPSLPGNQHGEIQEKPTSLGTQREEIQQNDPPKKIPDLFQIG